MTAYKLMLNVINRSTSERKEELTTKANTFCAANQLTDEQYTELIGLINAL